MRMSVKVTPKFNVKEIVDKAIKKHWIDFQARTFSMGQELTSFMQVYINSHRHRRGGTGHLAKSMRFYPRTSPGKIFWGIGYIPSLPVHWYVTNYGKMITGELFVPFRGKLIAGSFEGDRPQAGRQGGNQKFNRHDGSGIFMRPKSAVRPINYISATQHRLRIQLNKIFRSIKSR